VRCVYCERVRKRNDLIRGSVRIAVYLYRSKRRVEGCCLGPSKILLLVICELHIAILHATPQTTMQCPILADVCNGIESQRHYPHQDIGGVASIPLSDRCFEFSTEVFSSVLRHASSFDVMSTAVSSPHRTRICFDPHCTHGLQCKRKVSYRPPDESR
jgi:hypothetical protein